MAVERGTVIDGKYEILKEIGKGGMSVVYLAMDNRLNKQWAIKVLQRQGIGKNNEVIINTVPDDTELMKRLDHPSIPRIVDIIDRPEDAQIYIVMDYVEGESLDKILDEFGAQPQDLVIDWAKQICDTLAYLHSQKPPIIYRDMKPANIMLKPEGNIKLIDFGIAREYKEQNLADTTALGTRGYASPEHFGGRTDARSDIYTLGMTMHHLLTGADPRPKTYEYIPIREYNPELSGGLEHIIDKCTAWDPEARYQNCNELMYDLEHYTEIDGHFKKKQKRKLNIFIISLVLSIVFLAVGLFSNFMVGHQYDNMISVSGSYDDKINSYYDAINVDPNNTRAYMKILDAYEENGRFALEESQKFMAAYNNADFDQSTQEYTDLIYKLGLTYFYLYTGDDSFRSRIQAAGPYFEQIVNGDKTYENYLTAQNYYTMYSFYSKFILKSSKNDIQKEDYDALLISFNNCLNNLEDYEGTDASFVKLTIFQEIFNFLNSNSRSLATCKVEIETVLNLLDIVRDKAYDLAPTAEESINLRNTILDSYDDYKDNIETTYMNVAERSN